MVISFGISWPASIMKSYRAGTAKGKSLFFLCLIWFGYICGVVWKGLLWMDTGKFPGYPSVFYLLNLIMVSIDLCLYFRNAKLDKEQPK
ncbi:MAG TPA: hypothetical protein DCY74_02675 [Clostridiales bacterium]|nr:hypothetical protein [Clostridiales bacterium]HBE13056.1 hypothetical protein [Clostridiales bacterium]HCG36581.1 hypothetical protein [Clostridiales bacterium]